MNHADDLVRAFRDPTDVSDWSLATWDLVVRQARSVQLLARLYARLAEAHVLSEVPTSPFRHLRSAHILSAKYGRDVRIEAHHLLVSMRRAELPLILMKGAAYVMAGLPAAEGRLFSDVDILVRRDRLPDAESSLRLDGWFPEKSNPYDQRYYRQWMHELPPLRHVRRRTSLDVHHTILPLTARPRIPAEKILAEIRELPDSPGIYILAPEDMVLHAVVHCFHDGDFSYGLKELVDIDSLLRHFGGAQEFWRRLTSRAEELDVARPLWYALRYAREVLGTPTPPSTDSALEPYAPKATLRWSMDAVLVRALRPNHPSCSNWDVRLSRFVLYLRSHLLRMPLRLLLPHLARKAAMGLVPAKKRAAQSG